MIFFLLIRANFKLSGKSSNNQKKSNNPDVKEEKNLTQEEFEEFMSRNGAVGSFMIFRSDKKEDELGLEQL